jgi:hypothetical protein
MLGAMITKSGCFTLHDAASGRPADFLLTAVAGSSEEIDKTMNVAKGALTEGLVRSGAAGQVLGKVPMAGALMGMFGGLGGKKKTVSAGLRLVSPASGQTLIAATGQSKKSTMSIMGASDWVAASQGTMGRYASSATARCSRPRSWKPIAVWWRKPARCPPPSRSADNTAKGGGGVA